jgi:hypothetical protein
MAKQEVGLKIDVDVSSVGNIKKELRAATVELIAMQEKFGKTSEQAINAAKKVANLKDTIQDAKEQADLFDPGNKFKAFSNAATQVAAGFSAVQGAMALVGVESEDVQKSLLKVQGALALSQGLSQLKDFGKSWDELKIFVANATQGMSNFRKALVATGIGLFVASIATLIAYWDDLKDAIMGTNDITKAYAESQKEVTKVVGDTKTKLNEVKTALELAKDGVISKEQALNTYNKELGDTFGKATSVAMAENNMAKYTQTYLKAIELRTRAQVFYAKASEVAAKAASGEDIEPSIWQTLGNAILSGGNAAAFAGDQAKSYANNLTDLNDQQVKFTEEGNKLMKNALIEESKLTQSAQNIDNQSVKDKKKNNDEKEKLRQEAEAKRLAAEKVLDDARRAKLTEQQREEEDAIRKFEESKKTLLAAGKNDFKSIEEQKEIELAAIRKKYKDAEDERLKKIEEDRIKKEQDELAKKTDRLLKDAENDALSFEERLAKIQERQALENQIVFASEEDRKKFIAENEKAITDIKLLEGQVRTANAQFAADQLSAIAAIAGQDTAAGKALSVAAATISTYLSAQKAYESQFKPVAIVDSPIRGAIAAGVAIATGIANVRKILSVQVPGGRGGGGGAGISTSSPVAPQLSPQVTATQVNT